MRTESDLVAFLRADKAFFEIVTIVAALDLPDWAVGAGAIRNRVWDHLHGFPTARDADVDVLYFDASDVSTASEDKIAGRLHRASPAIPWSVRNQARMHIRNGDAPYSDTTDAISHWLETPTAVAVTLRSRFPMVIAPYGLADLFGLWVRPTPSGTRKPEEYRSRIAGKGWQDRWPRLMVAWPNRNVRNVD